MAISVDLGAHLEAVVNELVGTGRYNSKSEVLREAAAYRRPHSPPSVVSPRCRRPRATPPPPSFEIR